MTLITAPHSSSDKHSNPAARGSTTEKNSCWTSAPSHKTRVPPELKARITRIEALTRSRYYKAPARRRPLFTPGSIVKKYCCNGAVYTSFAGPVSGIDPVLALLRRVASSGRLDLRSSLFVFVLIGRCQVDFFTSSNDLKQGRTNLERSSMCSPSFTYNSSASRARRALIGLVRRNLFVYLLCN